MNRILIVGLGNPGPQYQKNRHNVGALLLDWIHQSQSASPWEKHSHQFSRISFLNTPDKEMILAHPLEYMNESGKSVAQLKNFYKIPLNHIIVIQDDTDIIFPSFKISFGRGAAGHRGISSIIQYLHSNQFFRFRIGVRPENVSAIPRIKAMDLVLKNFSTPEQQTLIENFPIWFKEINKIV